MLPLENLAQDHVFVIARLRELFPQTRWTPYRPKERYGVLQLCGYRDCSLAFTIYEKASTHVDHARVLVVRSFGNEDPKIEEMLREIVPEREVIKQRKRDHTHYQITYQ